MKLIGAYVANAVGEPRSFLQSAIDSNFTPTILIPLPGRMGPLMNQ